MTGLGMDNLKKAGVAMLGIFVAIGVFFVVQVVFGLIVGSVTNVGTSGDIAVSTAMNTSITGVETDYITYSESISSNWGIIASIIAIVVIISAFGLGGIFKSLGGKKKGGSVE